MRPFFRGGALRRAATDRAGAPALASAMVVTVAGLALALDLGERLAEALGVGAAAVAALIGPLAVVIVVLAGVARRERRARVQHERNLIRINLGLRQDAAVLERLARTDPLSGLSNRRHWHERLDEEWDRGRRYGRGPAVLLLDLDNFKAVNDRHGHEAGDDLIRAVAGLLRGLVRVSDVAGRLGGDEFVILLPEATADHARQAAEKIRQAVAGTTFRCGGAAVRITVSVGVASASDGAVPDTRALLRLADQALYDAKAGGRNRVAVAGGPISGRGVA